MGYPSNAVGDIGDFSTVKVDFRDLPLARPLPVSLPGSAPRFDKLKVGDFDAPLRRQSWQLIETLYGSTNASSKQNKVLGHFVSKTPVADCDFGPYMAKLDHRIKRAWSPPEAPGGQESKRVVVMFKLGLSGTISDLHIVQSSGDPKLDQSAIKAINAATPFGKLPTDDFGPCNMRLTFSYHDIGREDW